MNEEKLQDFIDGRMDEAEREAFAAYLKAHPEENTYATDLIAQNEALKQIGRQILIEDLPESVRSALETPTDTPPPMPSGITRRGVYMSWAAAASMAAVFVVGAAVGWGARSYTSSELSLDDLAQLSGRDAYMLYGSEDSYPVEFNTDRNTDLEDWIGRLFETRIEPPHLDDLGYNYVGGRVLPWAHGNLGFYLFENANSSRVALVWWPRSGDGSARAAQSLNAPGIQTRTWSNAQFGFAVYADEVNDDFTSLSDEVFGFYQNVFSSE